MISFKAFARTSAALLLTVMPLLAQTAETARQVIAKAVVAVADDSEGAAKLVTSLVGSPDPDVPTYLKAWKESNLYIYSVATGSGDNATITKTAVEFDPTADAEGHQALLKVEDGKPLTDAAGKAVRVQPGELPTELGDDAKVALAQAETDSNVRAAMKGVLDLLALASPDPNARAAAAAKLGQSQDPTLLEPLQKLQANEKNGGVKAALRQAVDLINLKSEDPKVQEAAAADLGEMKALAARDFLEQARRDLVPEKDVTSEAYKTAVADLKKNSSLYTAYERALAKIDAHQSTVNGLGMIFRGASLGSVLLVMAIGLAITFGLMGVINMAHGELIAIGAYTTYCVQNIFGAGLTLTPFGLFTLRLPAMNLSGTNYDLYFLVALPISFLVSALVGIAVERGVIRFLYRRPLESLLATWGVSLVLQQLMRLTFGANNVQVSSPRYLSGNWTVYDVVFGWNRVFVICFAAAILIGTILLLTRTPLGLLIRAVTQNRAMAACMGVRTERVNMLTFGFGSGLAGLAGAFYSQLGNVGPSMGQDHIVNAFMTVVVGGLGSLVGTVVSAVGIGVADQSLQQVYDPVLGKIIVLFAIILFFMWRPSGLFVTKSRNLEG